MKQRPAPGCLSPHESEPGRKDLQPICLRDISNAATVFPMAEANHPRYRGAVYARKGVDTERKQHHEGDGLLSSG
jgi:hypothetical protein